MTHWESPGTPPGHNAPAPNKITKQSIAPVYKSALLDCLLQHRKQSNQAPLKFQDDPSSRKQKFLINDTKEEKKLLLYRATKFRPSLMCYSDFYKEPLKPGKTDVTIKV